MSNEHKRAVIFCHRLSTVLAVLCIISQPLLMQIFIDAQHQSWVHREAYDFLWHVCSVWKSKHVAALEGRKTVIGSEIELQPLKWHEYNKALITQHVHYSLFIIQFGLELYVYVWRESKPKREREFCADYSV